MKIFRAFVALLALPAALSLAACGGGSTGIAQATGATSNIRYVNGAPGTNYDVYFTSTGTATSTTAAFSGLNYGTASDFQSQPATSATVNFRTSGSAGTVAAAGGCSIPQMSSGNNYSVVIENGSGTVSCTLFQDNLYSATGQYRFHNASQNATSALGAGSGGFAFGVTNGVGLPQPAVPYASGDIATFPGIVPTQTQFQLVNAVTAVTASTPVGFAIGTTPPNGTTTFAATAAVNANQFQTPLASAGTVAFPDTANTLPGGGYNNGSIFVIDASGTPGYELIGTFDSK